MSRRRPLAVGLALVLVVGGAACGGDDTADPVVTTTTTTAEPAGALPPAAAADLEPIYGAALADLGLQLTDRGGLIDRSGGGYQPSPAGTHLALYVEPIADRTTDEYIEGIRGVTVVLQDAFERWPGLASFDVCQEPVDDAAAPGTEPLPVTQIELTREEAAAIDWDTATVLDLVRASQADPRELVLRVSTDLRTSAAFEALVAEAS